MKRESGPTLIEAEGSVINCSTKLHIFASVWNVFDVIWQIFNLMNLSPIHSRKICKAKMVAA